TFIINIFDKNFVSSYDEFIESFSLKINSKFSDIKIAPNIPIYGQKFNISSALTTELGNKIPNKNVSIQFLNDNIWENFSSQISGINGTTNFEIDTLSLQPEDEFKFRLSWQGDQFTSAISQNITVSMFRAFNNISLRILSNVDQMFKNEPSTIQILLYNIGNSELNVSIPDISIEISPVLTYSIVQIDYLALAKFKPGDITEILIKIDVTTLDQMSILVSIEAINEVTQEEVSFETSKMFDIYAPILEDLVFGYFTLIMIGIFVLVWAVMYVYVRRQS
ncbi:unnamed protein product, partial [marine sediment metagenome]